MKTDGIFQSQDEINNFKNENGELIQPSARPGDLKFVEASYEILYGKIMVDWNKQDGVFTLNVSIPANCTAKIYMPNEKEYKTVGSGNYTFTK